MLQKVVVTSKIDSSSAPKIDMLHPDSSLMGGASRVDSLLKMGECYEARVSPEQVGTTFGGSKHFCNICIPNVVINNFKGLEASYFA